MPPALVWCRSLAKALRTASISLSKPGHSLCHIHLPPSLRGSNRSYGDSVFDARERLVGLFNYDISVTGRSGTHSALGGWHFSGIANCKPGSRSPSTMREDNSLYCDQFSFVNCLHCSEYLKGPHLHGKSQGSFFGILPTGWS